MINFLPISFTSNKIQARQLKSPALKNGLAQDTFERSGVSFKGNMSTFESWASKNKFDGKNINKIISNKKLVLGSGNSNTVFEIPNCEDYVIRIETKDIEKAKKLNWEEANFKDTEDKKLSINIGQEVGLYEIKKGNSKVQVQILKKQKGESIGNKPQLVIYDKKAGNLKNGEVPYRDISRKKKYADTIHKVASLPLSSFEKLIDEYQAAHKAGYYFDYQNSNNLLVDKTSKRINLVDMGKSGKAEKPHYEELLYSLINAEYYDVYIDDESIPLEKRVETFKDNKKIITNLLKAMSKKGVKFDKKELNERYFAYYVSFNPAFLSSIGAENEREIEKQLKKMGLL